VRDAGRLPLRPCPDELIAVITPETRNLTPADSSAHVRIRLAEAIRARRMEGEVLISSFNPSALLRIKRLAPALPRALIYSSLQVFPLDLGLLGLTALHPRVGLVHGAMVEMARARGYAVNAWTVNDPADMQAMIALGVDAITTDHPERLRALLPRA